MELHEILECIQDEPELPGAIPDKMRVMISHALETNDVDLIVECLRSTVRLTKQGIVDRIIISRSTGPLVLSR